MTDTFRQAPRQTYREQHERAHAVLTDFETALGAVLQLTTRTDDLIRTDLVQLRELAATEAADLRHALAHAGSYLRAAEYVARDYQTMLTHVLERGNLHPGRARRNREPR